MARHHISSMRFDSARRSKVRSAHSTVKLNNTRMNKYDVTDWERKADSFQIKTAKEREKYLCRRRRLYERSQSISCDVVTEQ